MVLEYSANYTIIGIECQAFLKYLDRPLDAPSHGVSILPSPGILGLLHEGLAQDPMRNGSLGHFPNPPFRETHEERNRLVRLVDPVLPPFLRDANWTNASIIKPPVEVECKEPLHVEGLAQVDQEIEAAINLLKQNRGAYSSIVILAVPASCLPRDSFLQDSPPTTAVDEVPLGLIASPTPKFELIGELAIPIAMIGEDTCFDQHAIGPFRMITLDKGMDLELPILCMLCFCEDVRSGPRDPQVDGMHGKGEK